ALKMARNLTRSSSGVRSSRASCSTRRLNSSQLMSRSIQAPLRSPAWPAVGYDSPTATASSRSGRAPHGREPPVHRWQSSGIARRSDLEVVAGDAAVPDGAQRLRPPAAGDDRAPLLVVQLVGVLDRGQPAIAGAHLAQRAGVIPDGQHRPLWKACGPPVLPAEVARERLRQAQRRAEPGEGTGLA